MKTIFHTILFLILSIWSIAQTGIVSGNLNVSATPTNNGNGTFTVVGAFSDPKGQYFASDVESALDTAQFVFWKGNNFYLVDTAYANGSELTLVVNDTYSTGFIPTGNAQILEITGTLGLPGVSTTGDTNPALATPPDHAALLNYIIKRIDVWASSIGGVGGSSGLTCGDTLTQAGHGFLAGDLLGQTPGNGPFFLARTSSADSLPVTAVLAVVDANTFVACEEGLFPGFTHGRPLGRDYFLQDDASLDTIPDSTFQVFAFRTRSANTAYFDIPELVITGGGSGGGGGESFSVTASNGLNDADGGGDVDVELGGTLDKDTDIELDVNNFTVTRTGAGIKFQVDGASTTDGIRISPNPALDSNRPQGAFLYKNTAASNPASVQWTDYDLPITAPLINNTNAFYVYDPFGSSYWKSMLGTNSGITVRDSATNFFRLELNGDLTRDANLTMKSGQYDFQLTDGFPAAGLTDTVFTFRLSYDSPNYFDFEFDKDIGGGTIVRSDIRVDNDEMYLRYQKGANGVVFRITPYSVVIESPPEYLTDIAADADSNLPSGGVYTLTGDRTLYIKP